MVVRVTASKTDQYRDGAEVVIARSGSKTCPVTRLEEYCKIAGICHSSEEKLF